MKTSNNVRSVAIAAAVLVSMNAFASDKYEESSSYCPAPSAKARPAATRSSSPVKARASYDDSREIDGKRAFDREERECPMGACGKNVLLPMVVAAEAAYVGEYAFAQLVSRAYTSKASAAKYAPVAIGLLGATYAGTVLAMDGRVQGLNCPKLGLMLLTALAVGVKQWKKEPAFVSAELDELASEAETALVAQPATSNSSTAVAASTDASKTAQK